MESGKKKRGRPVGSKNKQILATDNDIMNGEVPKPKAIKADRVKSTVRVDNFTVYNVGPWEMDVKTEEEARSSINLIKRIDFSWRSEIEKVHQNVDKIVRNMNARMGSKVKYSTDLLVFLDSFNCISCEYMENTNKVLCDSGNKEMTNDELREFIPIFMRNSLINNSIGEVWNEISVGARDLTLDRYKTLSSVFTCTSVDFGGKDELGKPWSSISEIPKTAFKTVSERFKKKSVEYLGDSMPMFCFDDHLIRTKCEDASIYALLVKIPTKGEGVVLDATSTFASYIPFDMQMRPRGVGCDLQGKIESDLVNEGSLVCADRGITSLNVVASAVTKGVTILGTFSASKARAFPGRVYVRSDTFQPKVKEISQFDLDTYVGCGRYVQVTWSVKDKCAMITVVHRRGNDKKKDYAVRFLSNVKFDDLKQLAKTWIIKYKPASRKSSHQVLNEKNN